MRKIISHKTFLQIAGALAVTLGAVAMNSSNAASQACPQTTTTWNTSASCNDSGRLGTSTGLVSSGAKTLLTYCTGNGCGPQIGFAVAHGLTSGGTKVCEVSSSGGTVMVGCPNSAVKHRVWAVAL